MKICDNGKLRDMTDDEIAILDASVDATPAPEPTAEERIAALEEELAAAKILLGLED